MCRILLQILALLFFTLSLAGQGNSVQFKHLDVNDGLSSNQIKTIFKDSRGYVWVGTVNGLNRFDGFSVKVFRHDKNDSTTLVNNTIISIHEDNENNLWIITSGGVCIYNPVSEKFSTDHPVFHKNIEMPTAQYIGFFADQQGVFWLIHQSRGIYSYNPETDSARHFGQSNGLMPYSINDYAVDKNGAIWLVNRKPAIDVFDTKQFSLSKCFDNIDRVIPYSENTYRIMLDRDRHAWIYMLNDDKGVFCVNTDNETIRHYKSSGSPYKISHNNVSSLALDRYGRILVGTDHGGLNIVDKRQGLKGVYQNEVGEKNSLSQNSITAMLYDNNHVLWVGTYKKGVNYYHPDLFKFSTYTLNPAKENWLSNEDINSFAEDEKGNLWLGSNGGGLIYFDRQNETFTTYKHNPNNSNSLSSNVIVDIYYDHSGGLWIGTYMGGLNYFKNGQFTHYTNDPDNPRSLLSNNVWAIHEDRDRRLWVGTLNGGASEFIPEIGAFNHYITMVDSATAISVMSISENIDNNIWFATATGVDLYDKSTGRVIHFLREDNVNSLSTNSTLDVYCDRRGWVWIGTRDGLNLYRPKQQQFTILTTDNGLPDNTVVTILEANDGNMWLATPQGLCNLVVNLTEEGEISFKTKNYDEQDGLHGIEFNEHGALRTRNGELIFGGSDGFSIFNPANLSTTMLNPRVEFCDLKVQNKIVETGEEVNQRVLLPKALNFAENVVLKHHEKTFSVSFSAINYLNPEKTVFHYKLEGFNTEWAVADAQSREVTYTNLHPGDYVLRIYASDLENSLKSDEIELAISILPSFWKTKWAYSFYLVAFLLLIFYVIQMIIKRERNKFMIQQERLETSKQHEMDMMKLKFFTNISHEFRTPLTLILSPLERLIHSLDNESHKKQLRLIQRNAKRLLNLVNQLLDFRKLEVQGLTLDVSQGDLVSFTRDTISSFSDLTETRNIEMVFESNVEHLTAYFDYDKIEKILFNLISNAFKFTSENGIITVKLNADEATKDHPQVQISVEDTGIGIPVDKQEMIFERFVQNEPHKTSKIVSGSGIGLSLTREFVQMHNGNVTVISTPGKGSTFTVVLPLKDEFEIQKANTEMLKQHFSTSNSYIEEEKGTKANASLEKILLVEDNPDIRFYLKDNLKADYQVFEAENGDKAWEMIPEIMPGLIVSDIMMPGELDGLGLCRQVKSDNRTSHIPVILLTARTSDQQKCEGLESRADDYITKPFNFELLELRIKSLIEQRRQMQRLFQKNFDIQPSEIAITSLDDKFLKKVKDITEANMQEPDFSVEKLSTEVGISRAHLYNKLVALTGKTPIEYIRIMRIRRAAQLLEKSQLTVMEVAYKVGFNDPRYFTKHFKHEYEMTPTQYIKKMTSKK
ncbi:MAG: ATP-binding protein [Prolixibacteraceae bacterium]|jgi:signal transduction histidine kinase/ligand-binding sensor domain-containing protein/DNA-binding response OmpR family regulator|nr:ATP-binding protein [Prolixibacteraceae bacterium]